METIGCETKQKAKMQWLHQGQTENCNYLYIA